MIIAVGLVVYSNTFDCAMQLDDVTHIAESNDLHDLRDVGRWWNHDRRRPIGYMTLALNYHFSGLRVGSYHVVNLAIHILTACLVFWLVRLTLATPVMAGSRASRHRNTAALFAGLLFVAHPIQTQAVTYIVQRLTSQAALFYLLALALYVKGRLWQGRLRPLWFVGSAVAGILAMLTKEIAFTLPFAVALYEFCFLSSQSPRTTHWKWLWLAGVGGVGLLIVPALVRFDLSQVFRTIPPEHGELFTLTPYNYALTQLRVIPTYMWLLVFPIRQNLDHDVPVPSSLLDGPTLAGLLVIAGVLVLAVKAFRTRRLLSFGVLWFFLTLAVESSFVPINDVMFEHRLYLPMFGFSLVVVELLLGWGLKPAVGFLTAAVLALGVAAHQRNKVWRDPLTLWSDAARKSPNKARPQTNAGAQYLERRELRLAESHLRRAIEINPEYALAHLNLAAYYQRVRNPDLSERHFLRAAEIDSNDVRPQMGLGLLYLGEGRAVEAEAPFLRALARDSTIASAYSHLGMSWYVRGDDERAIRYSEKALELNARQYEALNNLGRAWRRKGDPARARQYYERALEVEPQSTEVLMNMGNLALTQNDPATAEQLYNRALGINPGYTPALNAMGVMYYQRRDYVTAKRYFEDATQRNPENPDAQNNLGLCYLQEGQFERAIERFQLALRLRPGFGDAQRNLESAVRARGGG